MVDISIVVPVYNGELYLEQCIKSLVEQTYQNIEIIFVNGDSTDGSLAILEKYALEDQRIKIINKANEGVSLSRNRGIEEASGDYLLFVDADDWIEKNTCEIAIQEAKESQADVVMWSYVREFSSVSQPKQIFDKDRILYDGDDIRNIHRRFIGLVDCELAKVENADALCPVWGKLYRKGIVDDNRIKFIDIRQIGTYEDGLFNLFYFEHAKKAIYIQKYLYHYRKDNVDSITSKYKPNLRKQWLNLFELMNEYIQNKNLKDEYQIALNNRIGLSIMGQGLNLLESKSNAFQKIKELKKILSHNKYRMAYESFELKYFPIHWKIFYACAKYNFATGVYLLLLCIKHMIGR